MEYHTHDLWSVRRCQQHLMSHYEARHSMTVEEKYLPCGDTIVLEPGALLTEWNYRIKSTYRALVE